MASDFTGIYATVGAWSFTIAGKAVTTLYGDTLKNQIPASSLPARVLPPLENAAEGEGIQFVTFGASPIMRGNWILHDLLLYKPTTQGRGLPEAGPLIAQYEEDYANKVKISRRLASAITIVLGDIRPGVIEWPINSEVFYDGVDCVLTITEVF